MTPEQQRIAIAEACGITNAEYLIRYGGIQENETFPDYLSDLNAMHEAEDTMGDPQLWTEYDNQLAAVMDHVGWKYHATAAQRAEAFLRTLNLYTP